MKIRLKVAVILLVLGTVVSQAQAQTSDGGSLDGYSSDQGTATVVDPNAAQTLVPGTQSENSRTYGQGGTKPPLMVTISQPDYFLRNIPPQTSYADYSGKVIYTANPKLPLNITWDSNNGPAIVQFTHPNPTTAPYGTRAFLPAGGAYRIKLHANDGTLSDVDKCNVFVPRMNGTGGDVFVGSRAPLVKMNDINIPISENQNVGIRLVNQIRSPYQGVYVHIYINGVRYFTSRLLGQLNQTVETVYARKIFGSGNLHIEIYASSNNTSVPDLDEVFLVGTQLCYY